MAGGYAHDLKGIDAVNLRLRQMQRQIDEIRGSAGIRSAVIQGELIEFRDEDGNTIVEIGQTNANTVGFSVSDPDGHDLMSVEQLEGSSGLVVFGDMDPASLLGWWLVQNTQHASIYADLLVDIGNSSALVDQVEIWTQDFFLSGVGTHATPANLSIASGFIRQVASAAKYKDDIEPLRVDVAELLAISGCTYVDKRAKADHESDPEKYPEPTRYPGFIADEWAEHPTLRQFVQFSDDGEVESFYYDRLSAALLEVDKAQQAEIDTLKSTVSALEARLDALEGRT